MTPPVRLQLSRRKGFNLQVHSLSANGLQAVNCARPWKWGNRFVCGTHEECVSDYREWIIKSNDWLRELNNLRGKNLACWCKIISQGKYCPCHADVLISIANDLTMDEVIRENTKRAEREAVQ